MRLFNRKPFEESGPKPDGKVIAHITVDKVSARKRKVKAYAVSRETGETVYKLRFNTTSTTDMAAYRIAEAQLKAFLNEEGYILDSLTSNIKLPTVKSIDKGSRW